jgi:hypothetical protein
MFLKEDEFNPIIALLKLIPVFLAIGIFKRKDLARRICIWYFWIMCFAVIFSSMCINYDIFSLWRNIIITLLIVIIATLFLVSKKLKERFENHETVSR